MRQYIPYLFIAFFLFLLFPPFFYQLPVKGLDISYNIALCLAFKYSLVFGKDLVFTFGPLGILGGRLPISVSMWVYLLSDLYFLGTIFLILNAVFKKHFSYPLVLFIFLCITVAFHDAPFQRYFYFFLFYLFATIKEPAKAVNVVQTALLSMICFYYKVNLGIMAVALFLLVISYAFLRKKYRWPVYGVILGSYIAFILLTAFLLRVDLAGYIVGSWQLIDAYNDAMFLPARPEFIPFVKAALWIMALVFLRGLLLLAAAIRKKEVLKNADELFIHGVLGLALFVFFKSGFVRVDGSHIFYFFKISPFLAAFLYLYRPPGSGRVVAAFCCWAVLGIAIWTANTIPEIGQPYASIRRFGFFQEKVREMGAYCRGIKSYPGDEGARGAEAAGGSPAVRGAAEEAVRGPAGAAGIVRAAEEEGPHSWDIIPSEISTIYFNGLRYNPRPVIQSYSAYNTYLDSLNYQKYMSSGAPDYVLFALGSIDDRLAFFDESRVKLALLSHYSFVGVAGENLLLRKKTVPQNLVRVRAGQVQARIGEDIPVGAGAGPGGAGGTAGTREGDELLQYSKVYVRYNAWGRIRRLFYQPPSLTMTLTLEDGETMTYRAIPTLLEDGMIINKYVDMPQEFQLLMQSGARWCTNIKKIRFEQGPGRSGFDPVIRMENTYFAFPDKPEAERRADSIGVAEIIGDFNKYTPTRMDTSLYIADSLRCWVEAIKTYLPVIRIQGWAFGEKGGNENNKVGVVLRAGNTIYALPSENQTRPDLVSFFKRRDVLQAGFSALVSKSQLPAGVYQVGVTLYDTVGRKRRIYFTDRRVSIQ
jgi:hypothetical protein